MKSLILGLVHHTRSTLPQFGEDPVWTDNFGNLTHSLPVPKTMGSGGTIGLMSIGQKREAVNVTSAPAHSFRKWAAMAFA
jgi:hypothetical protein